MMRHFVLIAFVLTLCLSVGCTFEIQEKSNNEQSGNYFGSSSDKGNYSDSGTDKEINKDESIHLLQIPYIEDFNSVLDTSVWTYGGDTEIIPVTAKNEDYELTGTSTIKMPCNDGYNITDGKYDKLGGDSYIQRTVCLSEDSTVTFTFYPNANYAKGNARTEFVFYIDGDEKGVWQGIGLPITVSFAMTKGKHTLKWVSRYTVANSYFPDADMAFYLDRVSIASDEVVNVKIFPMSVQTVVVDESVTYTAKAYRADGSEIVGKDIIKEFLFKSVGEQQCSMQIDDVEKFFKVNVVSTDNLTEPIRYMGNTYNGIDVSTMTGSVANEYGKLEVSYPTGNSFDVDGFFPLKLNVNNSTLYQFMLIEISDGTNTKKYLYRGNSDSEAGELETRIWLRWGAGDYTVKLYDLIYLNWEYETYDRQKNTSADGSVIYQGDTASNVAYSKYPAVTFTVTNTRDEDGIWLYPSSVVQADDFDIMNKAADLTYGISDIEAKVKAIHDWIVTSKYYDYESLTQGCRKRQDAVAVMKYSMGVCEGYANLAAAMLRSLKIETKFISSTVLMHGWNHVNVGTAANPDWRLMDCTWDDPFSSDDFNSVRYENFLLTNHNGGGHTDVGEADTGRSISFVGHPDGVESIAY